MQSITEDYFFENFMEISRNLTYSEIKMLYLLITEPVLIELPQQIFANGIQTNRRTINIGLKKLKAHQYINDKSTFEEEDVVYKELHTNSGTLLRNKEATAKNIIINLFQDYYKREKKDFVVHEDFYSCVLGDVRLPVDFMRNKSFITKTIRDNYPEIMFYFELNKTNYEDDIHFYIVRQLNNEIKKAKGYEIYRIKSDKLIRRAFLNFSAEEDTVLKIIKLHFFKIRITGKFISWRQPYGMEAR